nr:unnamed protein product [Spirometra erinaceieuropaei]
MPRRARAKRRKLAASPPPLGAKIVTEDMAGASAFHAAADLSFKSQLVAGDFNLPEVRWSPPSGPRRFDDFLEAVDVGMWTQNSEGESWQPDEDASGTVEAASARATSRVSQKVTAAKVSLQILYASGLAVPANVPISERSSFSPLSILSFNSDLSSLIFSLSLVCHFASLISHVSCVPLVVSANAVYCGQRAHVTVIPATDMDGLPNMSLEEA